MKRETTETSSPPGVLAREGGSGDSRAGQNAGAEGASIWGIFLKVKMTGLAPGFHVGGEVSMTAPSLGPEPLG